MLFINRNCAALVSKAIIFPLLQCTKVYEYKMSLYGKIVVIKRNGDDGAQFPVTQTTCLFGRSNDCDIRIQLPNVSKEHCKIDVNEKGEVPVQIALC